MSIANFQYPGGITLGTSASDIDAIRMDATSGGVDINAGSLVTINTSSAPSVITLTANGATSDFIGLANTQGTTANSIELDSNNGGILLNSDGNLTNAIRLLTGGGTSETISIENAQGTSTNAISINAAAGGIDVDAASDVVVDAGELNVTTTDNVANAIDLRANGGASETIRVQSLQGTGSSAIQVNAAAGGIQLIANNTTDIQGNSIQLTSAGNGVESIDLVTNGGAAETLRIRNTQGTSASAIDIDAVAGGIDVDAAGDVVVDAGELNVTTTDNAANAIDLRANGGASETIRVQSLQGTGSSAIQVNAAAGGIQLIANNTTDIQGNSIQLTSSGNGTESIDLVTNGGAAETLRIRNTQGTSASAIDIDAVAGGIDVDAAGDVVVDAGELNVTTTDNVANAIDLQTNGGTSETIRIQNNQGTGTSAIQLNAAAGNVDIDASAVSITTSGSGGIDIDANFGGVVDIDSARFQVDTQLNTANAVQIQTNAGTSETLRIRNIQGTGNSAVDIDAAAGGTTINCNTRFTVASATSNFQAGIRGVTTGNADAIAVLVDSAGQLGTVSSSKRYKTDIEQLDGKQCEDLLMELKPVSFRYKRAPDAMKEYGFIAEDMEDIMPEFVVFNRQRQPETIQYHKFHGFLASVVQHQVSEIQELKKRLRNIEENLTDLPPKKKQRHQ